MNREGEIKWYDAKKLPLSSGTHCLLYQTMQHLMRRYEYGKSWLQNKCNTLYCFPSAVCHPIEARFEKSSEKGVEQTSDFTCPTASSCAPSLATINVST